MAGVTKIRSGEDDVYEATTTVSGGQLVVPSGAATVNPGVVGIAPAGAGAANVLGVAARRAVPVASQVTTGTDADGFPFTTVNPVTELTTVYKRAVVNVVYATGTAVAFGQKLQSAANGQVTAYTDASGAGDPATVVGECRVVGGVGTGGATGPAYIY